MNFETRDLPGTEIRSVDDASHEFEARVLSYNVADRHGTVWSPGVFAESLSRSKPPILFQHDLGRPIGRVLEHRDSGDGLDVRVKLADPERVPDAAVAYSLLKDGIVTGFSVGFANARMTNVPAGQRAAFGENPAREIATKGYLGEISLTAAPSVPNTALLSIRSEEIDGQTVVLPTVDEILALRSAGVIDEAAAQSMLVAARPEWREHIFVRDATAASPDAGDDDDDAATLAAATDAALDEAAGLLDGFDTSSLPHNVQQALALVAAAGVAVDQLLDVMGIDDDDDEGGAAGDAVGDGSRTDTAPGDEGQRADETVSDKPWSDFSEADYTPAQWKSACLIVRGDGDTKDGCSLPVREPDGTLNRNAVHSAAGMLGKVKDVSDDDRAAAAKKLMSLYSTLGEKPPGTLLGWASGRRSDDLDDLDDIFSKHKVA